MSAKRSSGPDQEAVDCRAAGGAKMLSEDLAGVILRDVLHGIQIAVQVSIADGGDDDIADAAMIDAGNLGGWRLQHGRGSSISAMVGLVAAQECRIGRDDSASCAQFHSRRGGRVLRRLQRWIESRILPHGLMCSTTPLLRNR
jgi:hypothetical protein